VSDGRGEIKSRGGEIKSRERLQEINEMKSRGGRLKSAPRD